MQVLSSALQDFWSGVAQYISGEPFLHGIAVAVIVALVWKGSRVGFDVAHQKWQSRNEYDIAGFWIGQCYLPSYTEPCLEIWCYRLKGGHVKLTFYSYAPSSKSICKWVGDGTWRGNMLSAFYYQLDKNSYESGVIHMHLKAQRLVGVYAQFDPKHDDEPLFVSGGEPNYVQSPLTLPFLSRLKMLFGRPPLFTYEEVQRLYGKCDRPKALPHDSGYTPSAAKPSWSAVEGGEYG